MSNVPTTESPATDRRHGWPLIGFAPTAIALWFAWLEHNHAKTEAECLLVMTYCPAPDYSSMWMWLAIAVVLAVLTVGFMVRRGR